MKVTSKIISYLLHPLFMPLLGVLLIYNSGLFIPYSHSKAISFLIITLGIATILLPLSLFPFFLYQKIISSIELKERRERIVPLLFTTTIYYLTFFLLRKLFVTDIILAYFLAIASTLFITTIVTYFIKVSMHMAGIGGLIGLLIFISLHYYVNIYIYLIPLIILSGLIGTVRLALEAHTQKEIYLGWGIGIFGVLLVMCIYF